MISASRANAAPFLRSMLAKNLNMRHTPELYFAHDDSLEYGMRMDALIESLHSGDSDADVEASDDAPDEGTEE